MANINSEINRISSAVYGREVRGSIVDALNAMNNEAQSAKTTATQAAQQVSDGMASLNGMQNAIRTANDAKVNLESATSSANNARGNLQTATADGEAANSALIQTIANFNLIKDSGDTLYENLQSTIGDGNELLEELDDRTHYDRLMALEVSNQTLQTALSNALTELAEVRDAAAVAADSVSAMGNRVDTFESSLGLKADDCEVDENGAFYLTSNGERITSGLTGIAGGGGGGGTSGVLSTITTSNISGWMSTTAFADDTPIPFSYSVTSLSDGVATGNLSLKVLVNGATIDIFDIAQGDNEIDLRPYVAVGSTSIRLIFTDTYGTSKPINLTVTVKDVRIESTFDDSMQYNDIIPFTYTPYGDMSKTITILVDGEVLGTQTVVSSGRQQTFYIPRQTHGAHSIEVYAEATVNGHTIRSKSIYREVICIVPGNNQPIISSNFKDTTANQYAQSVIQFNVYNPKSLTSTVDLIVGTDVVKTLTVDRTSQVWSYTHEKAGDVTLKIKSGDTVKQFQITVKPVDISAHLETNDLELYLSAEGRTNLSDDRDEWKYNGIECQLNDFDWITNGWFTDETGQTSCRVNGDANIVIPFKPFTGDLRTTGKTMEFLYKVSDVRDFDEPLISCMSNNRGFQVTPQNFIFKSAQSTLTKPMSEGTVWRLALVVNKRADKELVLVYINGTLEGVIQYPSNDDFAQVPPVNITVKAEDSTLDLYGITSYGNNLTRHQVRDNWIADCHDGVEMLNRWSRNNVFDVYGNIIIDQLPKNLPYLIIDTGRDTLPTYKGDKKTVSGSFVNPMDSSRNFTYENAQADVQGTSSQYYDLKNFKIKFNNGFTNEAGTTNSKYSLVQGAIPEKTFCFKADVASSEGVNNVELVRLYDTASPFKTAPQKTNPLVRQGIDGFPIVIFWSHIDSFGAPVTEFVGKYNFNNDKSDETTFGFVDGDESWETRNNTSNNALMKAPFNEATWTDDFEGRFPDGNTNITNLKALVDTVSTWSSTTPKATIEAIADPMSAKYMWLFTEVFNMVDSRGKNAFPTKYGSNKWVWLPYDFDTAIGINNEGTYSFDYYVETGDIVDGAAVFNAEGHKFWEAVKNAYRDEIPALYAKLRSSGKFSADYIIDQFEKHQAVWPESIFNESCYIAYLNPLFKKNDAGYLAMAQGTKKSVYKRWLKRRFTYFDSKYNCADNQTRVITFRGYNKSDLTITARSHMYINVKYGSVLKSVRANPNTPYVMTCDLDNVLDTETYIYGSDEIKKIEGLPEYQIGYANLAMATNLEEFIAGSANPSYTNTTFKELHIGELPMMRLIDVRNCINLGTGTTAVIDASGCPRIEEIYAEGTAITGVNTPNGGCLKVMHLPNTVTELTLRNQKLMTDLTIADGAHIQSLWIENVSDAIDCDALIEGLEDGARLRYIGFHKEANSIQDIEALMDIWDNCRGMDENGNTTDNAQVSGVFHMTAANGSDLRRLNERYPYVTVEADTLTASLHYMSEDGTVEHHVEQVINGADGTWTTSLTKPSTAQYSYSFDGWSETIGGPKSTNATKNVTFDRYIYAHYASTVRTYTVTFYTKDGGSYSVAQTVDNVPYGGSARFNGNISSLVDEYGQPGQYWSPAPTGITGNTSCYLQYKSPVEVKMIEDSWSTFMSHVRDGSYSERYSIGNYIPITLTDGKIFNAQIWAMDKLDCADGSGKAKLQMGPYEDSLLADGCRWNPSRQSLNGDNAAPYIEGTGTIGGWDKSEIRQTVRTKAETLLPDEVKNSVAEVTTSTSYSYNTEGVKITESSNDKYYIPDSSEIFTTGGIYNLVMPNDDSRKKKRIGQSSYTHWWLRSANGTTSASYVYYIGFGSSDYVGSSMYVALCFSLK